MSIFTHALERICAPVSDERSADGRRVLVDYLGHEVSEVSPSYALVQNRDIFRPFVERFGEEKIKRLTVQGRGRFAHMTIDTGREFRLDYNGESDVIKERLIVENSYNKTRSFRFMFGAFRTVCANGLYTGQAVLAVRRIHSGRIDVPGIVSEVLGNYEKNQFDLWRDFQRDPLDLQEELALVEKFNAFDEGTKRDALTGNCSDCEAVGPCQCGNQHAKKLNRYIRDCSIRAINRPESLDNQRNAWGALNGINRGISAVLRTRGALSKVISANQAAEGHILAALQRREAMPV